LMTVATQAERARGAARAAKMLAAMPNVIGLHWFQYADEPPGGRMDGEDYNFGLVDIDDRPYEALLDALRESNRLALRKPGRAIESLRDPEIGIVLPRADIDPDAENLTDWPKTASLIPLMPASSETVFGDVHLAWNERGLFLATISMDYFDPDLLGEISGSFPRSEAFRISLGVDVGGGPRRIEFRVVPQSVEHTSKKETKLSFAVETCWHGPADRCAAVPGAVAHYFGTALDQPRVILKAFVPWPELGAAGPPLVSGARLQLGVTAFYRSRWMSTGGIEPETALTRPERWGLVTFGGAKPAGNLKKPTAYRAAAPTN
jgi:hypothetical protein